MNYAMWSADTSRTTWMSWTTLYKQHMINRLRQPGIKIFPHLWNSMQLISFYPIRILASQQVNSFDSCSKMQYYYQSISDNSRYDQFMIHCNTGITFLTSRRGYLPSKPSTPIFFPRDSMQYIPRIVHNLRSTIPFFSANTYVVVILPVLDLLSSQYFVLIFIQKHGIQWSIPSGWKSSHPVQIGDEAFVPAVHYQGKLEGLTQRVVLCPESSAATVELLRQATSYEASLV